MVTRALRAVTAYQARGGGGSGALNTDRGMVAVVVCTSSVNASVRALTVGTVTCSALTAQAIAMGQATGCGGAIGAGVSSVGDTETVAVCVA